jgi:ribonuclease HI
MHQEHTYTDGGCSEDNEVGSASRKMATPVLDETGKVLVETCYQGGTNNIAELLAVKEAIQWAKDNRRRMRHSCSVLPTALIRRQHSL